MPSSDIPSAQMGMQLPLFIGHPLITAYDCEALCGEPDERVFFFSQWNWQDAIAQLS